MIGTFGDQLWTMGDPSSLNKFPKDLQQDRDLEAEESKMNSKQKALMKKHVVDRWKGIFQDS